MALFNRFYSHFPNTDFSQINLDWIIEKLANHEIQIQELLSADVPTEVAEQLQQMLDDGTIENLINQQILTNIFNELEADIAEKTWKVDTYGDMSNLDGLAAGDTVTTSGFYTVGDSGAALYKIVSSNGIPIPSTSLYAVPLSSKARAWGLLGDGSVETAALQQAITYSDILDLEDMNITIDGIITLHSNFTLTGSTATISVKNYTSVADHIIDAENLENLTISGIIFEGGTQTAAYYMLSALNAINLTVRGCTFQNGIGYRVRLSGSANAAVENCSCYTVSGISGNPGGFLYMQGGHDANFSNIYGEALQDHVIYLDGSVDTYSITVDGVRAYNTGVNALTNAAVVVAYGNVHEFTVSHVVARSVQEGVGIYERDGENPKNFIVSDCNIHSTYNSIMCQATLQTKGHSWMGQFTNNICVSAGQDCISIRFGRDLVVANNIVNTSGRWAIETTGADYITIQGNTIQKAPSCAINLGARDSANSTTSTEIYVIANVIIVNSTAAIISAASVTNLVCVGNSIVGTVTANAVTIVNYATVIGSLSNGATAMRSVMFGTSAPTNGYHSAGEIVLDTTGATNGWKCTASGAPGTWAAR